MSPSAIQPNEELSIRTSSERKPQQETGVLKQYKHFDVTPVIGREYPEANLVDWLNASNSDELLRDLAITSMSNTFI